VKWDEGILILIHYIAKWHKLIFTLKGINPIVHSNEPYIMLWEEMLCVVTAL